VRKELNLIGAANSDTLVLQYVSTVSKCLHCTTIRVVVARAVAGGHSGAILLIRGVRAASNSRRGRKSDTYFVACGIGVT